jgi:putative protease
MNRKIEVLAPAGSYESMRAAFNAGADAVYIGGRQFGARAYADNTTDDELLSAIDYAHLHGKQLYLTVNTLIKDREMEELYRWMKPLYEAGLDAAIVQDMGVFKLFRAEFPDLDIHASTQMTVTGPDGARLLKELGAVRVVPARELTVAELKEIYDATGMEVEAFIHGALCYGYSGQCLLSSLIGGRSGNRGRCAQACRLPFTAWKENTVINRKDEHIFPGFRFCRR